MVDFSKPEIKELYKAEVRKRITRVVSRVAPSPGSSSSGCLMMCPHLRSAAMGTDTKETMDFFMGPDDDAGIQFEDFITALAVWGWMRPGGQPTVREASDQFNVTDHVVLNAVKRHPWMFLAGEDDDDPTELKIEFDGE